MTIQIKNLLLSVESQDRKRELIIEAALKRFAHFGLSKTTMTEIASDLALSKALLYYYFPDKISLYAAVLSSIHRLMEKNFKHLVESDKSSEETMCELLKLRADFMLQYYNLLDFNKITGGDIPDVLNNVFVKFKSSETLLLQQILQKGVKNGELDEAYATANAAMILSDSLKGIVFNDLHPAARLIFPSKEHFDSIYIKQLQLVKIFFRGLKKA